MIRRSLSLLLPPLLAMATLSACDSSNKPNAVAEKAPATKASELPLFETFGIVHAVTQGGPSKATETLIYKVFNDGFIGLDFGGSSAQSVVLMLIVMVLTFLQFRYVERKVTY